MRLPTHKIIQGDVRAVIDSLPDQSIDVVVSSPPYFNQRDYKNDGQIGHEATSQEFVDVMVDIFYKHLFPKIKPHCPIFINLGDSYNGSGGQGSQGDAEEEGVLTKYDNKFKSRDMMNIPHRVYEGLREMGYWWRSTIIWSKKNGMPESVKGVRWERHRIKIKGQEDLSGGKQSETNGAGFNALYHKNEGKAVYEDCPGCKKCLPNGGYILRWGSGRPRNKYEVIGLLTPDRYYWDTEATRTPYAESSTPRKFRNHFAGNFGDSDDMARMPRNSEHYEPQVEFQGATLTNIWEMPTAQFKEKHFATFPEDLPELCIKSGSSEFGVCVECGAPYARMMEFVGKSMEGINSRTADVNHFGDTSALRGGGVSVFKTVGWKPTCKCNAEHKFNELGICEICSADYREESYCREPAMVFDPFSGADTTGIVANRLGRDYTGGELSSDYIQISEARHDRDAPLFSYVQKEFS